MRGLAALLKAPWLPWAALAAAVLLPLGAGTSYSQVLLNIALVNAILALSYHVIYGMAGILSIAQTAFWGIGAYTAGILSVQLHMPWALGFVAAPALAAVAGLLLGLPTLRLKTHYLVLATIGFGVVFGQVTQNWDHLTGGAAGLRGIPAPSLFGLSLQPARAYYYLGLFLLTVSVYAVGQLRRSRLGRGLAALRDDEMAAAATGVNVVGLRLMAFAFSAALCGLAGALYAHLIRYISPEVFHFEATVAVLAMCLIGGRRSVAGTIAGAVLLTYLPEWLRGLKDWYLTVYAVLLLVILAVAPDGLAGLVQRWLLRRTGGEAR